MKDIASMRKMRRPSLAFGWGAGTGAGAVAGDGAGAVRALARATVEDFFLGGNG